MRTMNHRLHQCYFTQRVPINDHEENAAHHASTNIYPHRYDKQLRIKDIHYPIISHS